MLHNLSGGVWDPHDQNAVAGIFDSSIQCWDLRTMKYFVFLLIPYPSMLYPHRIWQWSLDWKYHFNVYENWVVENCQATYSLFHDWFMVEIFSSDIPYSYHVSMVLEISQVRVNLAVLTLTWHLPSRFTLSLLQSTRISYGKNKVKVTFFPRFSCCEKMLEAFGVHLHQF